MNELDDPVFSDPLAKKKPSPSSDPYFSGVDIDNSSPRVPNLPSFNQQTPQQLQSQGLIDPIEGPQYDAQQEPFYRDYLIYKQQLDQINAYSADSSGRASLNNDELDYFYDNEVKSLYSDFFGDDMGLPSYTNDDRVEYINQMQAEYESAKARVAEGDKSWFGEDEDFLKAKSFATPERANQIDALRKKEQRLLDQKKIYEERALKAKILSQQFKSQHASIPNIFKEQAKAWQTATKASHRKAKKDFVDYDPFLGDVRGQGVPDRQGKSEAQWEFEYKNAQALLDSKYKQIDPFGGTMDRSHMSHKDRVRLRKHWQSMMDERQENQNFRSLGGIVSNHGMYNGHPVGITSEERSVLDLDALRNAGITQFEGKPVDSLIEEKGGEQRVLALSMASTVLKGHALYSELGKDMISKWGKEGHEERERATQMAWEAWQESLKRADAMGLSNDIIRRKDSESWFGDVGRAARSLYSGAVRGYERQKGTPTNILRILAGDGGLDESAIQQLIDAAREELKTPRSKDLINYMKAIDTKSDSFLEAFNKMFDKESYEGSAMVVMSELFAESMGSLFPAFAKNLFSKEAALSGVGIELLRSIISKKPSPRLPKRLGNAFRYAAAGSFGAASFQLSYIGKILEDLNELGIDTNNPMHFAAAWANPDIVNRLRKRATRYAGGVAFFDTVSAGVVGFSRKMFKKPAEILGRSSIGRTAIVPTLRSAAEIGMDAGLGMAGEYTGFKLSQEPGEKTPFDEIFLEGAVELGPGLAGAGLSFAQPQIKKLWDTSVPRKRELIDQDPDAPTQVRDDTPLSETSDIGTFSLSDGRTYEAFKLSRNNYDDLRNQLKQSQNKDLSEEEWSFISTFLDRVVYNNEDGFVQKPPELRFITDNSETGSWYEYDKKSNTAFIKLDSRSSLSIPDLFLHEIGHFAEDFLIDKTFVEKAYNSLTQDQKIDAILRYADSTDKANTREDLTDSDKEVYDRLVDDLSKGGSEARSEWLSLQIARVLKKDDAGMDSDLKKAIKNLISKIKEILKSSGIIGTEASAPGAPGTATRDLFDNYILQRLNVKARTPEVFNRYQGGRQPQKATTATPNEAEPKATAETKKTTTPTKETPKKSTSNYAPIRKTINDPLFKFAVKAIKKGMPVAEAVERLIKFAKGKHNPEEIKQFVGQVYKLKKLHEEMLNSPTPTGKIFTKEQQKKLMEMGVLPKGWRPATYEPNTKSVGVDKVNRSTLNAYKTALGALNRVFGKPKSNQKPSQAATKSTETKGSPSKSKPNEGASKTDPKPAPKSEDIKPESPDLTNSPAANALIDKIRKVDPNYDFSGVPRNKAGRYKGGYNTTGLRQALRELKSANKDKDTEPKTEPKTEPPKKAAKPAKKKKQSVDNDIKDALSQAEDLLNDDGGRLFAPLGRDRTRPVGNLSDIDKTAYVVDLFHLAGNALPRDINKPEYEQNKPIYSLMKTFAPLLRNAIEEGYYFSANGSNQFKFNEDGTISFIGNKKESFSNTSQELASFDELAASYPSTDSAQEEVQAIRKGILLNLSYKNLLVAIIDPEMLEEASSMFDFISANQKQLHEQMKVKLKKAKNLLDQHNTIRSAFLDFRTVLGSFIYQKRSLDHPDASHIAKLVWDRLTSMGVGDSKGLMNRITGVDESQLAGLDEAAREGKLYRTFLKSFRGIVSPGVAESIDEKDLKRQPVDNNTAFNFIADGFLGFDQYVTKLANFYGITVDHYADKGRYETKKLSEKFDRVESVNTRKLNPWEYAGIKTANEFVSSLMGKEPAFDSGKQFATYQRMLTFYRGITSPPKNGRKQSKKEQKRVFYGFTGSLKEVSPAMRERYSKSPSLRQKGGNGGAPIVPDRFPAGDVGYKLHMMLDQRFGVSNNIPNNNVRSYVYVEDEAQWYDFTHGKAVPIGNPAGFNYEDQVVFGTDYAWNDEYAFPLSIKLQVELLLGRNFPKQSTLLDLRSKINAGVEKVTDSKGNETYRFVIDHNAPDGMTVNVAKEVFALKSLLDDVDGLPFQYETTQGADRNTTNLSDLDKQILEAKGHEFFGTTGDRILVAKGKKTWAQLVKETKNKLKRTGDSSFVPTMFEMYYTHPKLPYEMLKHWGTRLSSLRVAIEAKKQKIEEANKKWADAPPPSENQYAKQNALNEINRHTLERVGLEKLEAGIKQNIANTESIIDIFGDGRRTYSRKNLKDYELEKAQVLNRIKVLIDRVKKIKEEKNEIRKRIKSKRFLPSKKSSRIGRKNKTFQKAKSLEADERRQAQYIKAQKAKFEAIEENIKQIKKSEEFATIKEGEKSESKLNTSLMEQQITRKIDSYDDIKKPLLLAIAGQIQDVVDNAGGKQNIKRAETYYSPTIAKKKPEQYPTTHSQWVESEYLKVAKLGGFDNLNPKQFSSLAFDDELQKTDEEIERRDQENSSFIPSLAPPEITDEQYRGKQVLGRGKYKEGDSYIVTDSDGNRRVVKVKTSAPVGKSGSVGRSTEFQKDKKAIQAEGAKAREVRMDKNKGQMRLFAPGGYFTESTLAKEMPGINNSLVQHWVDKFMYVYETGRQMQSNLFESFNMGPISADISDNLKHKRIQELRNEVLSAGEELGTKASAKNFLLHVEAIVDIRRTPEKATIAWANKKYEESERLSIEAYKRSKNKNLYGLGWKSRIPPEEKSRLAKELEEIESRLADMDSNPLKSVKYREGGAIKTEASEYSVLLDRKNKILKRLGIKRRSGAEGEIRLPLRKEEIARSPDFALLAAKLRQNEADRKEQNFQDLVRLIENTIPGGVDADRNLMLGALRYFHSFYPDAEGIIKKLFNTGVFDDILRHGRIRKFRKIYSSSIPGVKVLRQDIDPLTGAVTVEYQLKGDSNLKSKTFTVDLHEEIKSFDQMKDEEVQDPRVSGIFHHHADPTRSSTSQRPKKIKRSWEEKAIAARLVRRQLESGANLKNLGSADAVMDAFHRWVGKTELENLGIKSRMYDDVLDSRQYLSVDPTAETDDKNISLVDSPKTTALEKLFKATLDLQYEVGRVSELSPAKLKELGLDRYVLNTAGLTSDHITNAIDGKYPRAVVKKGEDGKLSVDPKSLKKPATALAKETRDKINKLRDDVLGAWNALHLTEKEDDSPSFFMTPQMLATTLWNAGISVAAQQVRDPKGKKDQRGNFQPDYDTMGLDQFDTDDMMSKWAKNEMVLIPIPGYDAQVIGGKLITNGSLTTSEMMEVFNQYSGFPPNKRYLGNVSVQSKLKELNSIGLVDFVSKYGDIEEFRKISDSAEARNTFAKYQTSASGANTMIMDDGGTILRRKVSDLPAELYLRFIGKLINGYNNFRSYEKFKSGRDEAPFGLRINSKESGRAIGTYYFKTEQERANTIAEFESRTAPKPKHRLTKLVHLVVQPKIVTNGNSSTLFEMDARPDDVVFLPGKPSQLYRVKQDQVAEGGQNMSVRSLEKIELRDAFRNKNGDFNKSKLITAFMVAFAETHPITFMDINHIGYQAMSQEMSIEQLEGGSPGLVDALAMEQGKISSQKATNDFDEANVDFDNLDRGIDTSISPTQQAMGPRESEHLDGLDLDMGGQSGLQKDQIIHGKVYFADRPQRLNAPPSRKSFWMGLLQSAGFGMESARDKFKRNERDRRNFLSNLKHSIHSGVVNSYYELEELGELMLDGLLKAGNKFSENEMDRLRIGQRLRTYMGKTGVRIDEASANYKVPFMEKAMGIDDPDPLHVLGEYWYARFAPIRNKNIQALRERSGQPLVDNEGNPYGSGMSDLEAQQIVARTEARPDFNVIKDITSDFDRMNRENLQILLQGGVLPRDQYDRLIKQASLPDGTFVWTPLRGFEKEMVDYPTGLEAIREVLTQEEMGVNQGTGQGFSQKNGRLTLESALGRQTRANVHEMWGNAFRMYNEAIVRANKNTEVSQSVLELAKQIQSDPRLKEEFGHILEIADPKDPDFDKKYGKEGYYAHFKYNKSTKTDEYTIGDFIKRPLDDSSKEVFTVRVDGEPLYIIFKGDIGMRVGGALKNKYIYQMGPFLQSMRAVSGFFSQLYTVWNIDFVLTNFFRDFVSGVMNLQTDNETKDAYKKMFSAGGISNNISAMYKISRAKTKGKRPDSLISNTDKLFLDKLLNKAKTDRSSVTDGELKRLFDSPLMTALAMQRSGGKIEFFGLRDHESQTREMFSELNKMRKSFESGKAPNHKGITKRFFDFVSDINTGVENATRMQAFKVMVLNGATFQNAAYKGGREGTVDFNRKGNYTNAMNALFPFFGAGIAGNARLIKALTTDGTPAKRQFKTMLASKLITFGLFYSWAMRLWAGDDEETEEQHWDRLSSWEKKHNLNIFLKPGGDGSRLAIPLPYGWNILFGIGANGADFIASLTGYSDKKYGMAEAITETVSLTMDTFHPMGGAGVSSLIPHAVRPFMYDLPQNKDFLGNPIMPEQPPWAKYEKPDSELYWGSVNPVTREFTRKINELTGGNEFEAGNIFGIDTSFSPETFDYMIGYYGGTLGRQILDLMGSAGGASGLTGYPRDQYYKKLPVAGRLFKPETRDTATTQRFYNLNKIIGAKEKVLEELEGARSFAEARHYRAQYKSYFQLAQMSKAHTSRVGKIQRDISKRSKAGLDKSKIQLLEQRLQSEKLKGMSSVLKKARELGIRV